MPVKSLQINSSVRGLKSKIVFDQNIYPFIIVLIISQFAFLNGLYLFFGLSVFFIVFFIIQIPFKPTIFTIVFSYHMVQILSGIWLCNYLGKEINYRSEFLGQATLFSYLGLIVLLIPVYYVHKRLPQVKPDLLNQFSNQLSTRRVMEVYILMFFLSLSLSALAFQFSGLTQIIFSIKNLKWFFFSLFVILVIKKKELVPQLIAFSIFEFAFGFFSFFSDFKTIIFYVIMVYLFYLTKVNLKQILLAMIVGSILFYIGVRWTAIKGEYRSFLNQGTKTQSVNVDRNAAFNKLMELSENETDFDKSAAQFFDRTQYTYHLAKTMERVPFVLPHEEGKNWMSIISYVTTPRFLNPEKEINQTSVKATKYTGIAYLGYQSGVSFSLGYFADSYVDFGSWGMMIPLFLLGILYALIYYYFTIKSTKNLLVNYALVGSLFMEIIAYECDGTYLLGRLFSNVVTYFLFVRFLLPTFMEYIKNRKSEKSNLIESTDNHTLVHPGI